MTDSPNGREIATAVRNPASPVVRIRIGRPVRSGSPNPPAGHSARLMTTTATIGMRMPSWGLMIAAMTV